MASGDVFGGEELDGDLFDDEDPEWNESDKPRDDENNVSWFERVSRVKERGRRFGQKFRNMASSFYEKSKGYSPLDEEDIPMDVLGEEAIREKEALRILKERFPNMSKGKPPFTYYLREDGKVEVALDRRNAKWHVIDGKELPKKIENFLGDEREVILEGLSKEEKDLTGSIEDNDKIINDVTADALAQSEARTQNAQLEEQREKVKDRTEEIEDKMSIKDRVKRIFKEYGFTVTAVVASVGVIIGVIISNLKAGLTTVAKGVGNGLKSIGKKLGTILPGMVGAIASFIFKTAGEVVGFLGKNAWLLIVGVVLYVVDRVKKKK